MITHEIKEIFKAFDQARSGGSKAVLATVVALEGSSYRRPGVRMLLFEDGRMVGAVSGGCVEKEVFRQAHSVFRSQAAKVMTYDGRYRLGCEGLLYILLEPFAPSEGDMSLFLKIVETRCSFKMVSHFDRNFGEHPDCGTQLFSPLGNFMFRSKDRPLLGGERFEQALSPCFRLIIFGGGHDAIKLCAMASSMGWEVTVVTQPKEDGQHSNFPGATHFIATIPESLVLETDDQTALVMMTHSYVKDLQFLIQLQQHDFAYLGLLGPSKRREKLLNDLMENHPEVELDFMERISGPAGLDIGAETPQEIAVSIIAEILSVIRRKDARPLHLKEGQIHV